MSTPDPGNESGAPSETRPANPNPTPESEPSAEPSQRQFTGWTRLLLRQVSVETLRALNVGFEFDPEEPSSVLVKRPMSSEEQDLIFRHTSKLREERAAKVEPPSGSVYESRRYFPPPPPRPNPFAPQAGYVYAPPPPSSRAYDDRYLRDRYRTGISPSRRVESPGPIHESDYDRAERLDRERYYDPPSPPRREREPDYYKSRSPSPVYRYYDRGRERSRSRARSRTRGEEYRYYPPEDDGKPLKFDVNLVSLAGNSKENKVSRPTKVDSINKPETVSIETSRRYSGDSEGEKVVLTTGLKSSPTQPSHFRWIHLEHQQMSFESLQQLLLQTDELNSDDVLIALQILRKFQQDEEKPYVHGHYLNPNVLRCDSRDVGPEDKPDRVCTFVVFPYFSYQSASMLAQKGGTHLHSARGLLQTLYYLESTKARDLEQVTRKLRPTKGDETIYVAQMWAIILGGDTLITYSTASLETMRGEKIQISKPITTIKTGPSTIRVTDPFKRLFFFSLDECKTWFELTNIIHEQCMKTFGYSIDECDLFLKDDQKLKALSWSADIEAQKSAIVDIFVRFKDPQEIEEDEAEKDRRRYRSEVYGDDYDVRKEETRRIRSRDTYDTHESRRPTGITERTTADDYVEHRRRSPGPRVVRRETQDRNDMALVIRRRSPSPAYARARVRSRSPPTRQQSVQVPKEERQATRRTIKTNRYEYSRYAEAYEEPVREREVAIARRRRDSSPAANLIGAKRQRPGPRYAAGGLVVNELSRREEKTKSQPTDIYYLPENEKDIPVVNITAADDKRSKLKPEPKKAVPEEPKIRGSGHRSRSSTRVPPVKPSVPPILMWPVGRADPAPKPGEVGVTGTANPQAGSDSNIVDLLDRVHDHLLADQYYDHSRLFLAGSQATRNDAIFKLVESEQPPKASNPTSVADNKPIPSSASESASNQAKDNLRPVSKEPVAEPDYLQIMRKFYEVSGELLDAFLPANYPSPVANRYYGAMRKTIELVNTTQNHYFMKEGKLTHRGYEATIFVIKDVRNDPEYPKNFHIKAPREGFSTCKDCLSNHVYRYESAAFEHLREVHFRTENSSDAPSTSDLSHWIQKVDRLSVERCAEEQLKVLKRCGQHLFNLQMESREIRDGVSTDDKAHQARYRLPKALVEAFQRLVILLIYVTHLLELVAKNSEGWVNARWEPEDDREYMKAYEHMIFLGFGAETNMSQGKLDLIQMIRMEDYTQSVSYEAVGPEYILAMVMSNLQGGINCPDLVDVYKEWTERLAYQVSQRPRKRLLRDFQYLSEEIRVLNNTLDDQYRVLENFRVCLYPGCFRVTTETRISMYDIESQLINKIEALNIKATDDYREIDRKVDRLVTQTKMSIEILDDDHGKAIFVFTVVTLVFLPLSFVSSLLGMNTIDIRNQETTQWLFWAIAVPITVVVVLLALLVAYRYDEMREWVDRKTKTVPK